jgi:hypothetical protein
MEIKVLKRDKGLGDTVARITKMTGIQSIANYMSNGDVNIPCTPCEERKRKLNEAVSYGVRKDS